MNRHIHLTARGERVVAAALAAVVMVAAFIGAHALVAFVCGPEVLA